MGGDEQTIAACKNTSVRTMDVPSRESAKSGLPSMSPVVTIAQGGYLGRITFLVFLTFTMSWERL